MTWVLISLLLVLGFGEYWCAHYFTLRVFKLSENRAHLALGGLILTMALLPRNWILAVFLITCLLSPFIFWLGIRVIRNSK